MPLKIKLLRVEPSEVKPYKYTAFLHMTEPDGRVREKAIHFGRQGYEDFTIHKDEERRQRYIARHQARENWENPLTRGFWSRWVLWEKKTLREAVANVRKKFCL